MTMNSPFGKKCTIDLRFDSYPGLTFLQATYSDQIEG
jgi:hypothetical protein